MSSKSNIVPVLVALFSLALFSPLTSCGADVCFFSTTGPLITSVTPDVTFFTTTGVIDLVIVGGTFDQNVVVVLDDATALPMVDFTPTRIIVQVTQPQISPNGFVTIRVRDGCGAFSGKVVVRVVT